ncbi:MAG: HEAT repeat domain-containing protein [Chitinophagaceae bacterium]
MKITLPQVSSILVLLTIGMLFYTCKVSRKLAGKSNSDTVVNLHPSPAYLSPKESIRSMQLPAGYHLELVACEPMIQEPVAIVWDGNAVMYVAEMNTYMQDMKGGGQQNPVCKIKRLEDTNDDGKMDKQTVYIDSLVLPRMMLTVGRALLVNESFSNNIWSYSDTNGDGKAETKRLIYKNDNRDTGNLEIQRSGLLWNLDNWIYITHKPVRFRYRNNMLQVDSLNTSLGQWGLTNDTYGRLFFSNADEEIPALGFQVNPVYTSLEFDDQLDTGFQAVWPIISTPDVQGGMQRLRKDSTLNHFTAGGGQSIFRGDRLPAEMEGDLFICEPAGRLIRRAKVINQKGKITLHNAYNQTEFLASTDMNFRPVNTATGPDGCLYIVDMNRGVIKEAAYSYEFLRSRILARGLEKNTGHGRIYRLVHEGYKPGPKPYLLDEPSGKLITYLDHPNGWWRDNAQKELIIRGDRSVIPALKEIAMGQQGALKKKPGPLARMHALWTLEGLNGIDKEILLRALTDEDPQVRKTAVWISEPYLHKNDKQLLDKLAELKSDSSADVRAQLLLSLYSSKSEQAISLVKEILESAKDNEFFTELQKSLELKDNIKLYGSKLAYMSAADRNLILQGKKIFVQICSACHGPEGRGLGMMGGMGAPPFVGSKRVSGESSKLIKILLDGLIGPIDGKTYPDYMPPFGAGNDDEWIASILSYIRYNFGNLNQPVVNVEEVKKLRSTTAGRSSTWTLDELEKDAK